VNSGREWQKNEGEYFPEWLRETSVALIEPVSVTGPGPAASEGRGMRENGGEHVLQLDNDEHRRKVEKGMGAGLAVTESTGLLFYEAA